MTKAGVPANKVFIGVSSYGRSFKMANPKCKGPMCTYLGARNASPARKGACTDTAGYIADGEINQYRKIYADQNSDDYKFTEAYYDKDSDSDIFIWDDTWVAYMDVETKNR